MKIHIVQKGDTLWKIAKKYGVNFEELKALNSQLSNTDMIMPGMKIKVPTSGGNIKKEAPIMGTKKEMPIAMEPIVKEAPKKEMPIKEMPKKEMPKEKPYTPKMPTPIIPEIDVTNYYSMNMTNVDVDVDIDMEEKIVLPPKPAPVLPKQEPVVQQEACPPIVPYQPYCYEVSPMMPGSGFPPGVCPPAGIPVEQLASQATPFPGVEYTEKHKWEESSSSYSAYTHGQVPVHGSHVPHEYYQQPLVQYGQMPVEHQHHKKDESSEVTGLAYQPYVPTHAAPVLPSYDLPYKEDCGCGAPSFPQQPAYPTSEGFQVEGMGQGYAPGMAPMPQGFGPEMGAMAGGYNPGMGMASMPQGFGPEMGAMAGGYNPGVGMAPMPQGFGPEMGAMAGGYNPGMEMGPMPQGFGPEMGAMAGGYNPGMGMGPMPQGFGPEMGAMAGGYNPGMGMAPMPQGFGPEMGAMAGGYNPGMEMGPMPQGFGPEMGAMAGGYNPGMGMAPMPQGFSPEMGAMAGGYNPGMGMVPMPQGIGQQMGPMMQSPYPQGMGGNTPMPYPGEYTSPVADAPSYEASIGQPVTPEMNPPVYGPGGNAPVFTPPYNPTMGQPPFMNPYGVNQGTPFGMPRYQEDESSDL
ncbi:SafA/ExsA family spore coat assembly protein [Niallia sp. JL1B1071]|uniref:SafA/ExsA family spore coat assembly protein n=1 Tax=Niallia tiangongensis TaxID=3237105 RepID=UPI0037DCF459